MAMLMQCFDPVPSPSPTLSSYSPPCTMGAGMGRGAFFKEGI